MVGDKEMEAQECQDEKLCQGGRTQRSVKTRPTQQAERTIRVWGVNRNTYSDDKNQTGVLHPNYTLESSGEHLKASNTWAPNQTGGIRVWEMGSGLSLF